LLKFLVVQESVILILFLQVIT